MLVRYLLCEKEGRELLNHIAVALVPIANVNGYAIATSFSRWLRFESRSEQIRGCCHFAVEAVLSAMESGRSS